MPLYVAPLQNVFQGIYQADWSVTDSTSASYINGKPTNLSQFTNDLAQPNWTMATTTDASYIQNKPTALSQFTNNLTSASIATQLAAATLTGTLTTIAGTTTSAPLVVPAGTLLTTATVGSIESDSNVLYHTHTTGTNICRTIIDACQFFRRTTTSAAITTLSDVFNLSPYFKAGNFYEVEYYVVFTNTGAFIPNLAWFTTTGQPTLMYGDATVTPSNTTAAVSATTFNSTGSKQLASGNAAGTFLLRYRGVVVTVGNAFSPQMSVATSGSLTILPGSYYKVFNRGA